MTFKQRLKEAREKVPLSQAKVASVLGVTRQAVGNWESENSGSTPDPETLAKLADLYGVSVDWLLERVPIISLDSDDAPIEQRIVRAAAASGDLSGWSEEQIRRLETQIRIAKAVILAEEEEKRNRIDSDN